MRRKFAFFSFATKINNTVSNSDCSSFEHIHFDSQKLKISDRMLFKTKRGFLAESFNSAFYFDSIKKLFSNFYRNIVLPKMIYQNITN